MNNNKCKICKFKMIKSNNLFCRKRYDLQYENLNSKKIVIMLCCDFIKSKKIK